MYKPLNQNLLWYILLVLPLTFIIGIAITEVVVAIVILYFFYKNRSLEFIRDKKFIFLFVFSIYIGINAFIKIDDNLKTSSFFHFRYPIFAVSVLFILDYFEKKISNKDNYLLIIIFTIICFLFLDVFIQYIFGENILGYKILDNRISSVFGSELILGSFLFKMLPIILWLIFYLEIKIDKNKNYLISFFSLYFIVIYLSGERTSFALMNIFLFLVVLFVAKIRKILLISLTLLVLFIALSVLGNFGKSDTFNRVFVKTFNQITNNIILDNKIYLSNDGSQKIKENIKTNIQIFSTDHMGHYTLAYELFKNNPIFGVGPKGFRYFCRSVEYDPPKGICSTHPHNFLIQILSETGLTGLFFYFYGIFFVIYKLFKVKLKNNPINEKNCLLVMSIALITNFFPFVPNGNFFNNWISITSFYYIGIYLYSYKRIFS